MRIELVAGFIGCAALLATACGDDGAETSTTASTGSNTGGATASSSASNGGSNASSSQASTTSGMGGMGNYPPGPYGNQEGDTFPQIVLEGYLSTNPSALATTETWTDTYTSVDLYTSGADYALIHTTLTG